MNNGTFAYWLFLNNSALPSLGSNSPMKKKCSNCHLVNFVDAGCCARCQGDLIAVESVSIPVGKRRPRIIIRALVCLAVCIIAVLGFYFSLVISAEPLNIEQKSSVRRSTAILKEKGFSGHAFLLENLTVYRSNDNWLNASVAKENAYAATNFPFEIMTLYSDFFTYPVDDVERAAILLHEAEHLKGHDEHEAYKFVWENRNVLGWTKQKYWSSPVWQNIRKQTIDHAPDLFVCENKEYRDCTE